MRNSQSDAPELSSLALRQYQANFRPERVRVLCAPLANVGGFKTGKCRFAAAPAKAGAYVGQQVVGIGFSRCVREAQVSGLLKHPPSRCRFRKGFLYLGYAKLLGIVRRRSTPLATATEIRLQQMRQCMDVAQLAVLYAEEMSIGRTAAAVCVAGAEGAERHNRTDCRVHHEASVGDVHTTRDADIATVLGDSFAG